MAVKKKHIALRIIFSLFLFILLIGAIALIWISSNYKRIIMDRLPAIVAKSSDSVYHMSLQDISINFLAGNATIKGLKIWPDKMQVKKLRARQHRVPPTPPESSHNRLYINHLWFFLLNSWTKSWTVSCKIY